MTVIPSFHPVGIDRDALLEQLRAGGFAGLLLTSPETGINNLTSSFGNSNPEVEADGPLANGIPLLDRFAHVGHNIGLETEEEWRGDDAESVVKAGMAINIELYSQAPTDEMIGNEETYLIHDHGPERISVLPREIYRVDARAT
jgi:hypothetical protein